MTQATPLTSVQEAMLLKSVRSPAKGVYIQQCTLELPDDFEPTHFIRAWQALLRRHEGMRIGVNLDPSGRMTPSIHSAPELPLRRLDWSNLPSATEDQRFATFLRKDAEAGFPLHGELLFRLNLVRLDSSRHRLVWTSHHAIIDGESRYLLLKELFEVYQATRAERQPLSAQPPSFQEFAAHQSAQPQDDAVDFWSQALADGQTGCTFRQQGAGEIEDGHVALPSFSTYHHVLSSSDSRELMSFRLGERPGLQFAIQAAWAIALRRYSGCRAPVFGVVRAGRDAIPDRLSNVIGPVVRTQPMCVDVSASRRVGDVLSDLQRMWDDSQHLPALATQQVKTAIGGAPDDHLFDNLLNFSPISLDARLEAELPGWIAGSVDVIAYTEFPLVLNATGGDRIHLSFDFDRSVLTSAQVERLARRVEQLLVAIPAQLAESIRTLPRLTLDEYEQFIGLPNATAELSPQSWAHSLVERQARETPDRAAVSSSERCWTYAHLDQWSSDLADRLRQQGHRPGAFIGVFLNRSPEQTASMLAAHKAGGTYVPLDPSYTAERLAHMLEAVPLDTILTDSRLAGSLPNRDAGLTLIDDCSVTSGPPTRARAGQRTPRDLAYVLFTSGSTGKPKAVGVGHGALANLIAWHQRDDRLKTPARTLQFASSSFDVSIQEVFSTWACGGHLLVAHDAAKRDPAELLELLQRERIDRVFLPYVALQQLACESARSGHSRGQLAVRDIVCAGEQLVLTPEIRRFVASLADCRLHNHYGPTESHVATTHVLGSDPSDWPNVAPIGQPVANCRAYLCDDEGEYAYPDTVGELHIAGNQLAWGYLNRPRETEQSFYFALRPGRVSERGYRTGDLCRWNDDGQLEFLGRLDRQIKVRGFRVEPGEIEASLNKHPALKQSHVMAVGKTSSEKRLVAFCVPAAGPLETKELRRHLKELLPPYMIPSSTISLSELPLTPSGKVDEGALAHLATSQRQATGKVESTGSPLESDLVNIWRETLGNDEVGLADDFFEMGGDSLSAVRMIMRVERIVGRKIPVASLFENGTVERFTHYLSESESDACLARVIPISPGRGRRPLFVMPSIAGELVYAKKLVTGLSPEIPVLGVQPVLAPSQIGRYQDFRVTASEFADAIQAHTPDGPYSLVGYSYGGLMAYAVACELSQRGASIELLTVIDTGPNYRGIEPSLAHTLRWSSRVLANAPFWLAEELKDPKIANLAQSSARWLRRWKRRLAGKQKQPVQFEDVFEISSVLRKNQELMRTVFRAFHDYLPSEYSGTITLLRGSARPLFAGSQLDLGWGRFAKHVDILRIGGNHDTILKSPHVGRLSADLSRLLDARIDPLLGAVPASAPLGSGIWDPSNPGHDSHSEQLDRAETLAGTAEKQ